MRDTSPEIEKMYIERIMALELGERLAMCFRMFDAAKAFVIAGIKHQNPEISEAELRKQTFLRFYGRDFSQAKLDEILRSLKFE